MKRTILVLTAALAACGTSSSNAPLSAAEARNAMPTTSQAQIATPAPSSSLASDPVAKAASANVESDYAFDTVTYAAAVNGGVAFTLGIVQAVVNWPPTSCSGATCTWGPGSGPLDLNVYELVVTKVADEDYTWALQGYPKTDTNKAFITFVSGEAFTTSVKEVGHGTILADMDAAQQLAYLTPPTQVGKISAQYDNRTGVDVSVQFLGTPDAEHAGELVNAAYQFTGAENGGDLQVAAQNTTSQDILLLHSRWTATGAGRGDAQFESTTATYTESECWDSASTIFNLLYETQNAEVVFPEGGTTADESLCAFAPAELPTITPPTP
jgi:hypothetical protein